MKFEVYAKGDLVEYHDLEEGAVVEVVGWVVTMALLHAVILDDRGFVRAVPAHMLRALEAVAK